MLRHIPLFEGFSASDADQIARLVATRRYRSKEVIVRQLDPGPELFVILEGHAKVISSGSEGRDTALDIVGPGEVFDEVSLLDGGPRSATIVTLTPCTMLVLHREPFMTFLERNPKVAIHLLQLVVRRLRRLTHRAEDIAFLDVSARLAKRIAQLAEEHGAGEQDGVRVLFRLSQQEIGDLIGATRESANKHLRLWEQQRLVSQRSGHLIVHDIAGLRRLGNRLGLSKGNLEEVADEALGQVPAPAQPVAPLPPASDGEDGAD